MVCLITAPKIADKQALFLGLLRIEAVALYPSLYRGYHHGIVADPATGERKKKRDSFDENAVEVWPTLGEAGGRTGMDGLKTNFTDARWIGGQTDRQTDRQALSHFLSPSRETSGAERERLGSTAAGSGKGCAPAALLTPHRRTTQCAAGPSLSFSAPLVSLLGERKWERACLSVRLSTRLSREPLKRDP